MKMLVKGTSLMHDACLFPLLVTVTNALDCDKRYAMCNVTNGVAVLRCASNCCRIAKSCVANALSFVFDCGSPITLLSSKNMPGTYQYEIIVMAQIVTQIWVFFLKSILADTVSWYMIFSHSMHSTWASFRINVLASKCFRLGIRARAGRAPKFKAKSNIGWSKIIVTCRLTIVFLW